MPGSRPIAMHAVHAPGLVAAIHVIHTTGLIIELTFFALAAALALRVLVGLVRFAVAPAAAKRNYPRVMWSAVRWRWLARQLGLSYIDPHQQTKIRAAFGPSIGRNVRIEKVKRTKVRCPRARFRADVFGLVVKLHTIPKVGRKELEDNAEHLANYWRCHRVRVSQPKPGRLIVRGLRTDPLTLPFGMEGAPAGVFTSPVPFRPYIGRDEWAEHRYADLRGVTGITIGGLPGLGKTSEVLSLLWQLSGSGCVQFVNIDGKGGDGYGDYQEWNRRAWLSCGDDLGQAASIFETLNDLMRQRMGCVAEVTGHRNAWHTGPTPEFPLIVGIVDECHTYFDLDGIKGSSKEAKRDEDLVRKCRYFAGQIVKKGRSVLFLLIFITQKQTGDAIPTAIRDNCPLGFCYGVKTRDAAVAALGESIRDYPSYCPTGLQERPDYIGVCTASMRTGQDPFIRLRVPEISEAAADQRARETAHLRRDPFELLPRIVPLEPEPVPADTEPVLV